MQDHIDRAIDTYKNGEVYDQTSDEFTKDEDGLELYLSLQHFNFSITVIEEIREKGFWFWKHTEKRYVATVTVTDRYNLIRYENGTALETI